MIPKVENLLRAWGPRRRQLVFVFLPLPEPLGGTVENRPEKIRPDVGRGVILDGFCFGWGHPFPLLKVLPARTPHHL